MVPERWTAGELIAAITQTFTPWDDHVVSSDPLSFTDTRSYRERLATASRTSGTTEAVLTGLARVGGREAVLVVGAFEFLAGTQGIAVGERVVRAFERAALHGWPVVGIPASGGTRMQEGALAFVQMLKIAATVAEFRRSGGRYLAWLRHPTTGGVLASWGTLAHVTWAQPGALIGLTGPRVIAQMHGEPLPDHVQRAEHLCARGIVDDVVPAVDLPVRLPRALTALGDVTARSGGHVATAATDQRGAEPTVGPSPLDGWAAVERSRASDRPGLPALLDAAARDVVVMRGDATGGRDDGCMTMVCRFRGLPVVLVGHDRPAGRRGASVGADGYRAAQRAMRVADQLGLPLVTVVDTRGAAATVAAEEGGVAAQIAGCMATMSVLRVPTVAVLLGEGSGGGAIAWLAGDRVVAAASAWLAPIAPEGASSILFRTTDRAPELARTQAIDAVSLRSIGVVDHVVAEDAGWISDIADVAADALRFLTAQPPDERLAARARRLRAIGMAPRP